jgi:hypothetical protein
MKNERTLVLAMSQEQGLPDASTQPQTTTIVTTTYQGNITDIDCHNGITRYWINVLIHSGLGHGS